MKYKVALIVPYFGKLPNYFDYFLRSLAYNPDYCLLLFTDDFTPFHYPVNVRVKHMSFEEMRQLLVNKFNQEVSLEKAYKLCDYKPAYGYIFSDYLKAYDFWGYCDVDLIFGRLDLFLMEQAYDQFDRLLMHGHLSIYRNTDRVNHYFELCSSHKNAIDFSQVIKTAENCFYDEIGYNQTLIDHHIPTYLNYSIADIIPIYPELKLSWVSNRKNKSGQEFFWENGHVYRIYRENGAKQKDEFMYIHLQKRAMAISSSIDNLDHVDKFYIKPNEFQTVEKEVSRHVAGVIKGVVKDTKRFNKCIFQSASFGYLLLLCRLLIIKINIGFCLGKFS